MEHEKIIQDVKELLKFPNLGKALFHKIEELKLILARNLNEYLPMLKRSPGETDTRTNTTRGINFELTRVCENLWIPSIPGKPECNPYEIIPQPLIDYIVDYQVKTGVIEMKPGLRLPEVPGEVYNLTFEKGNPKFIWGTIRKSHDVTPDFIYPHQQANKSSFPALEENPEKSEVIKLLLHYLLSNDDYYKHVAAEFFYRWRPIIDSQLITKSTTV
ncbi:MAG: hypothetical protein JSV88_03995 [Candidatus Aminicenantes bacterium]|nr:MAG: hypothetical protein JSV88_03995 [Candidatus Aminicenantes bacterium]